MSDRFIPTAGESAGFGRYPEYRDSGVEWLGEIPAHWEVVRVKHVLARNDGGVWGSDGDVDGTIVLRSTEQTVDGAWNISDPAVRDLTRREYAAARLAKGDLVVTKSSGSARHIGKTSLVTKGIEALDCCHSNFMQRLRVRRNRMTPRYLWYVLNGNLGRRQFDYYSETTTGLANLSGKIIGMIRIAIPTVSEQSSISDFLDDETARIDALLAKQQELIAILEEKRTALISHAVTKGLDPDVVMKDSGVEWLGEIPVHWEVKRVKWVARMESGHTPDKKVDAYWNDGDIPWVSLHDTGHLKNQDYIRDTESYTNELGLRNSSARLLPPRSVIFSRDATIGLCAITERSMAVSQHFIAWICNETLLPEYLLRVLGAMQGELVRLTMGATLRTIGMPDIKTLTTPIPAVLEQDQIVAFVRKETAVIDALVAKVSQAIDLLKEFRAALISAAVTGKIDVREVAE